MRRISAFAFVLSLVSVPAFGQTPEADVTAAVKRTFDAYNKGDSVVFKRQFYALSVRGFYIDNGALASGDDIIQAPTPPDLKPSVTLRQLNVRVYGTTAVIAAYIVGQAVRRHGAKAWNLALPPKRGSRTPTLGRLFSTTSLRFSRRPS